MAQISDKWKYPIEGTIRALKRDLYHPFGEITFEGFETEQQLSFEEAMAGPFRPMPENTRISHEFGYLWLRGTVTIPEELRGERINMDLAFGTEATLFVSGHPFGTLRAAHGASSVRERHHFIVDNTLTRDAVPGETFEIAAEVYCAPIMHDSDWHGFGAVLPEERAQLSDFSSEILLGKSTYGLWNEEAYQLYLDAQCLYSLLCTLPQNGLRAQKVLEGLKRFTTAVDFEQPLAQRRAEEKSAGKILKPLLKARNGDTAPAFSLIGNSHMDLAWLWKLSETERKTARTFAGQLRHLEEYPDYMFFQSQPASYEMCRQRYPEVFYRVQKAVRDGRWAVDGAMWVEADVNIPSGESLVRQLVYGKRFLKEAFGVESRILWLPDTFGYNASLPQILSGANVPYMMTAKILWNYNGHEPFRDQFFRWRGNDGSEITVFIPKTYVCRTEPEHLNGLWEGRIQREELEDYLVPFGYGDGGGGPCRDDIEYALREKDLEGLPRTSFEAPVSFFDRLAAEGKPTRVYANEVYFAAHQGTYTSGARVKQSNRRLEFLFREAECWGALAMGEAFPKQTLDELWKSFLLQQFHDILPGSSIGKVYEDTERVHQSVRETLKTLSKDFRSALVKGTDMTVFNSAAFARRMMLEVPQTCRDGAVDAFGNRVPVAEYGGACLACVDVPSCGWNTVVPEKGSAEFIPAEALERDGFLWLQNEHMQLKLNSAGEIVSAKLCASETEYAAAPMNALKLYRDIPQRFDAWDYHESYKSMPVPLAMPEKAEILCGRGLRAAVKFSRSFGCSRLEQTISLDAGSRVVKFDTEINWQEDHRLLKVSFPTTVQAKEMINDIQYGYVTRPLFPSTPEEKNKLEVVNHRYSAICNAGRGMAVLNDCKYGISADGTSLELTLLRAPMAPQPGLDRGSHSFCYGLMFWEGTFEQSGTAQEAQAFNLPTVTGQGTGHGSMLKIGEPNLLLEALKPAEDGSGDIILRIAEVQNCPVKANIQLGFPVRRAWICDLLENRKQELRVQDHQLSLDFDCFKVHTIRLERD